MSNELTIGGLFISRDKQQIKAALVAVDRSEDWARLRITRNIIWEGTLTELDQQWSVLPMPNVQTEPAASEPSTTRDS